MIILVHFIMWWYGAGWRWASRQLLKVKPTNVSKFFSISDLLRTLFAPFRQDAIPTRNAPIGVKLQVLGGNIISRFFGFMIRSALILVGCLLTAGSLLLGVVAVVMWPVIPLLPVLAIVLFLIGARP